MRWLDPAWILSTLCDLSQAAHADVLPPEGPVKTKGRTSGRQVTCACHGGTALQNDPTVEASGSFLDQTL